LVQEAQEMSKPGIEAHRHCLTVRIAIESTLVFGDPSV
jgi:hypothetical protein